MLGPAGDVEMEHWSTAHTRDSEAFGIRLKLKLRQNKRVEGVGGVLTVEVHPQLEGEDGLRQRIAVPAGQSDDPRNKNIALFHNRAWYCNKNKRLALT